jgi:amidase
MKKKYKIMISLTIGVLVIGGIRIKQVVDSFTTEKIEYQSENNDKIVNNINQQLLGYDLEQISNKEHLVIEADVEELQLLIKSGHLTYSDIMAIYLMRIKTYDQGEKGLNSMISINPKAMEQAKKCDKEMLNTSIIYGLPIALKDNINTNFMTTTGGTVALEGFIPSENAPLVNNLIANGGIIIGKTNLSELANFMSANNPNGFTNLKGQNMNPYGPLTISTYGSSSGSATAVSTNFATLSIGTETAGSIVAPSAIQNVVGFRPTQDQSLIVGVIPLAPSLDMTGPITRTVKDALYTYNAMSNSELDSTMLDLQYLNGKKLLLFKDDSDNKQITDLLTKLGATYEVIEKKDYNFNILDILKKEYSQSLEEYFIKYNAPVSSLQALVDYNNQDKDNRAKYGQSFLDMSLENSSMTNEELKNQLETARLLVENLLSEENDGILFLDNLHSELPCLAGAPELTVPLYIDESNTPHGLTVVTKPGEDLKALQIGYAIEMGANARQVVDLD